MNELLIKIKYFLARVYVFIIEHRKAFLIGCISGMVILALVAVLQSCHSLVDVRDNTNTSINGVTVNQDII